MTHLVKYLRVWVVGMALMTAGAAWAQEKKGDPAKPVAPEAKKDTAKPEGADKAKSHAPPDQAAEMEAWIKAAAPGAEHKNLEYMVGNWDVGIKHWMMGPDSPAAESKGIGMAEWVLDGRFVRYTFSGDFMGPFEGRGITGYDNIDKKYVAAWVDTMGTQIQTHSGTYEAASKTFTFLGEFKDPSGQKIKTRHTVKVVSNDQHIMTFYHTEPGKPEVKAMELTYNRKK